MAVALAAILAGAPSARGEPAYTAELELSGNVAVPTEVYLSLLDIARPGAKADSAEAKASAIAGFLERFLRGAGYDLAKVTGRVEENRIQLEIDEGRLDKVIFVGEGGLRSLQLQFQVDLPGRVFNRPYLERQLRGLIDRERVLRTRYQVVPVAEANGESFQLKESMLLGLPILRPGEPHELRIFLEYSQRKAAFDVNLSVGPPDAIAATTVFRFYDVFLDEDRVELVARLGFQPIDLRANDGVDPRGLTRARAAVEWYTPPFISEVLRSFASTEIDLVHRDRMDLGLRRYYYAPLRVALNLEVAPFDVLKLSLGGGLEQRFLFGLDRDTTVTAEVEQQARNQLRPYGVGRLAFRFNPDEIRRDRAHQVDVEARLYSPGTDGSPAVTAVSGNYALTIPVGWDEVRIGLHGAWLSRGASFYQQTSMADGFLRLTYASLYTDRGGALALEYRLSLVRDLLKASVFNDVAAVGDLAPNLGRLRVIDTFGVGLHLLVLDTFQINTYVGPAFSTHTPSTDFGLRLSVLQAF